ncbi:hypothetical protein N8082_05710 [Planktomarina temperata]|nr:hypothetical protein [Planktomarina temperata]
MTKPSRVFWAIGLLGLIWNALGCFNFILQMDPDALADFPPAYRAVIAHRPGWVTAAFSVAVFGGGIGLCFDAAAPGHSAAGFVCFASWRGADNGSRALGRGCGARGDVSCNVEWHVLGGGGRFGLVHAPQGGA